MKLVIGSVLLLTAVVGTRLTALTGEQLRIIGPTDKVTEVSTGLQLMARVDTGATSCSIHCEGMKIADLAANPQDNIGKRLRFLIRNSQGQSEWCEAVIEDSVKVRTSEMTESRYRVLLSLRCQDVEKNVLVTLNDRQNMRYPVLIGRNFLRGDFVVDAGLDGSK